MDPLPKVKTELSIEVNIQPEFIKKEIHEDFTFETTIVKEEPKENREEIFFEQATVKREIENEYDNQILTTETKPDIQPGHNNISKDQNSSDIIKIEHASQSSVFNKYKTTENYIIPDSISYHHLGQWTSTAGYWPPPRIAATNVPFRQPSPSRWTTSLEAYPRVDVQYAVATPPLARSISYVDMPVAHVVLKDCGDDLKRSSLYCEGCRVLYPNTTAFDDHRLKCSKRAIRKTTISNDAKLKARKVKTTEKSDRPHKCNLCDYSAMTRYSIKIHMRSHSDVKAYKCHVCDYSSKHNYSLQAHLKKHNGVIDKPYKCNLCDYTCSRSNNINSHMWVHKEATFKCNICDKKFSRKNDLKVHVLRCHSTEKPFECNKCEYKTNLKVSLSYHMRTHQPKTLQCDLCGHKSSHKNDLAIHIKKHSQEQKYKCELCSYKTAKRYAFKCHELTHSKEKPYKCNYCDHASSQKTNLEIHIKRIHTKEFTHQCYLCDNKFVNSTELKLHIMRRHKK